jgi:1,4-alpha-glucan branching enzyme
MGNEFGQTSEWNVKSELDWHLLQHVSHHKLRNCVKVLGHLYKTEPALYLNQFDTKGFEWIELTKKNEGIIVYKRKGNKAKDDLLIILNISNQQYTDWNLTVSGKLKWIEIFNSDAIEYWGSGNSINNNIEIKILDKKSKTSDIVFNIPPLSAMIFK